MPYSPWVTQRRNIFPNAQVADTSSFQGVAGQNTMEYTGQAVRWTFTVSTAAGFPILGVTYTPNVTYRMMIRARASKVMQARMRIRSALGDQFSLTTDWAWYDYNVLAGSGTVANQTGLIVAAGSGQAVGAWIEVDRVLVSVTPDSGGWYSGGSAAADPKLGQYIWEGAVNNSVSAYQTRTYTPAIPVIPVKDLTTEDVLYNDRVTSYRWEVLEHSSGVDQLIGILDGVSNASLSWTQNVAVKGSGKLEVLDLDAAQAGMLRVADLKLESVRVRPVCSIEGLPENPLGVFLISAAKEEWEDTGRVWSMELLDKCTVPSQDVFDQSYAVAAGTLILQQVRLILASCNEYIAINSSSTLATSSGMVWEAGTSKLKIINDLLDVAGYNALWMDGYGNFQATPRVLPADRSILYEVLGIPRELVDGEQAIYRPSWQRDRDSFEVPNKVIAVQAAGGTDDAALIGTWTNEDPNSPYSYQSRGRWIPHVLDSVECPDGTDAEITAFLQKRAQTTLVQMSAVQAQVSIEHLPIPARVSDVVRFAHARAGVDSRHVITKMQLDANPLGTMKTTLQEVITL